MISPTSMELIYFAFENKKVKFETQFLGLNRKEIQVFALVFTATRFSFKLPPLFERRLFFIEYIPTFGLAYSVIRSVWAEKI